MSKKTPSTLLEVCHGFIKDLNPDSEPLRLSQSDAQILIEGQITLAQVNPVQAIKSSFVLMAKTTTRYVAFSDDLFNQIIVPNLGAVHDADLSVLREIAAKTVSYAARIYDHVEYTSLANEPLRQELVRLFQVLSRTEGHEGQVRDLADYFVGRLLDGEYGEYGTHNTIEGFSEIMPFTTAGQITFMGGQAAKRSPGNNR